MLLVFDAHAATRPAAADGWLVDRWTMDDGLPLEHAMDVVRTPDGTLWIATLDGLVRFDGVRFDVLGLEDLPELPSNRHAHMAVHPDDGALWILSDHGLGISRWQGDRIDVWSREGPFGAACHTLSQDAGGLWLGTDRGMFELTSRPERRFAAELQGQVIGTVLGPDGVRWIATPRDGLLRVGTDGRVERLEPGAGAPHPIRRLLVAPDGGPLVLGDGVAEGVGWVWREDGFVPSEAMALPTTSALAVGEAPLALAGRDCGWRISSRGVLFDGQLVEPMEGTVTAGFCDADGALWLTTTSAGVLRIRPSTVRVVRTWDGEDAVAAVRTDPAGRLWLRGARSWWTPGPEGPEPLQSGLPTSQGYLLELDGAPVLAEERWPGRFSHPLSSHRDPAGRLWIGDRDGLLVVEDGELVERHDDDGGPIEEVREIEDHPAGGLLLASAGRGLLWLDPAGAISRLDEDSGVRSDNIRHLRTQGERLWVSTEDAGLCVVPLAGLGSSPWRCVGERNGLPARGAHVSVPDGLGRVWVSTNHGLGVARGEVLEAFARGERADVPFLVLGTADGMASAEANGGNDQAWARDRDGVLWFATQRGAAGIDPARFELPDAPVVSLLSIEVGGEQSSPDPLRLAPDHPPLRVRWAVPESIWADRIRFRTRLDGEAWTVHEGAREATFTRLPPGPFRIEVQAGLADAWGPGAVVAGERTPRATERASFPWILFFAGLALAAALARLRARERKAREERLEAEVVTRTAELAQSTRALAEQKDQLEAQAARLEQLDELRTRMIVNLHHELRTPLSLVVGPLEQLLEEPGADPRRCGELAQRNARELEKLVDQMFDIARLEAGELPVRARRIDLCALVRRTLDRLEHLARTRGVELRGPACGPTPVWCDPDLVDKALGNLVGNALKFTPSGGTVEVTLSGEADRVRVGVLDDGPGIDAADRERVFERLFQVDRGDARKQGGAGLGLAIAREVVELHGGRIGVDARQQGGSAFWFTLPAEELPLDIEEVALEPRQDGLAAPEPEAEPPNGEGPRVLVVEDHADMRAFIAAQLAPFCRVTTAEGGEQALELARAERPDLVVTDVMMPGMTGLELAGALRGEAPLASVPILVVSAKAAAQDRVAGLEVADDYLVKPFRVAELRARVRRLLDRAPAGGDEEGPPDADRALRSRLEQLADERLCDPDFGVAELAKAAAMSERTLRREVHRLASVPPGTWLRERRLEAARRLMEARARRTVGEVAAAVGLSRSYFSRAWTAWAGSPPGESLEGERGDG